MNVLALQKGWNTRGALESQNDGLSQQNAKSIDTRGKVGCVARHLVYLLTQKFLLSNRNIDIFTIPPGILVHEEIGLEILSSV